QFVGEDAILQRLLGTALALHGERILLGATDLVAIRYHFGGLSERDRPFLLHLWIDEAPPDRRVGDLGGFAGPRIAALQLDVGGARHALHTARDERVAF